MAGRIVYTDVAPGAAQDAVFSSSDKTAFSDMDLSAPAASSEYITAERNLWVLNGMYEALGSDSVSFWSSQLSDADGEFSDPPVIDITFSQQHTSLGLYLIFDKATGNYCSEINVKWYQGSTLKADEDYYQDATEYFCEKTVTAWNRIVITIAKTSLPYRRARIAQIIFGIIRSFGVDEIRNASAINEMDLLSAELPASKMNWTLDSKNPVSYMFQLKQPIEMYDGSTLIGVYYVESSTRQSSTIYQVTASDAIGVLGTQYFSGGVYLNGISAKTLLQTIIDGAFDLTFSVTDKTLYGLLVRQTKREAIQQVLFAAGWCCRTDGGKDIKIFEAPTVATEIGTERTYTGVSVQTAAIVTKVSVVGHTYTASADGSIEVLGQKYADAQTVYDVFNPDVTAADVQNDITVDSATLVSTNNGQATARRVFNHYLRRNTHRSKIIFGTEKLGDCVTQPTPWGTTEKGNIRAMTIMLSGVVAAEVESLGVEE